MSNLGDEMAKRNDTLRQANKSKNDEFYTQYEDIQREVNAYLEYNPDVFRGKTILLPCDDPEWSNFTRFFAQNFENFGLKKIISTSYAIESRNIKEGYQLSIFEMQSPQFDEDKTKTHGKIFTLTRDSNKSGVIDIDDLEWHYLEGDGDFRSDECIAYLKIADIYPAIAHHYHSYAIYNHFLNSNFDRRYLIHLHFAMLNYILHLS